MSHTIYTGDCIEVMRSMDESSVHAIVTDPPYGLEFMGKKWDRLIDNRSGDGERMDNTGGGGRTTDPYIQSRVTYQGGTVALGRTALGIEVSKEYVAIIERRMEGVTSSLFADGDE